MFQFHEDSTMTIHGSSNVRNWTMDVQTIDGEIVVQTSDTGISAIDRIQVEIPVVDIVSDHDSQMRKAHDALQNKAHPTIIFRSDEVDTTTGAASGEGAFQVAARGALALAGKHRTVVLHAEGTRQDDGTYRFSGEHGLRLSDFGVKRPTAMFGALRVSDEVTLTFDITITPV